MGRRLAPAIKCRAFGYRLALRRVLPDETPGRSVSEKFMIRTPDTHRKMLRDRFQCDAYRCVLAASVKPGDVVLNVGAGPGLLSLLAAQAGAARVYAVEHTSMAGMARELVRQNDAGRKVQVIHGDMESVQLPEKADVVLSECLAPYGGELRLLAPVLLARDRWLKAGGKMLPAQVTAWLAPAWDGELAHEMILWRSRPHGVDLQAMADSAVHEPLYGRHHVTPECLRAAPQRLWTIDLCKTSLEQTQSLGAFLSFAAAGDASVNALALWFAADFGCGITLSTAPDAPDTYWGRTVYPLNEAVQSGDGARIDVEFTCTAARPGVAQTSWSVRIAGRDWEHHDTTNSIFPAQANARELQSMA